MKKEIGKQGIMAALLSVTREAKAGRLLEPENSRLAWTV